MRDLLEDQHPREEQELFLPRQERVIEAQLQRTEDHAAVVKAETRERNGVCVLLVQKMLQVVRDVQRQIAKEPRREADHEFALAGDVEGEETRRLEQREAPALLIAELHHARQRGAR